MICRCVLGEPYYACLSNNQELSLLNLFKEETNETKDVDRPITIALSEDNFKGPFRLSAIPGDISAVSVNNGLIKRIVVLDEKSENIKIIPKNIDEQTSLYITTADNSKVLLETSYNHGVRIITKIKILSKTCKNFENSSFFVQFADNGNFGIRFVQTVAIASFISHCVFFAFEKTGCYVFDLPATTERLELQDFCCVGGSYNWIAAVQ